LRLELSALFSSSRLLHAPSQRRRGRVQMISLQGRKPPQKSRACRLKKIGPRTLTVPASLKLRFKLWRRVQLTRWLPMTQWRRQALKSGWAQGVWETEVPQRGSWARGSLGAPRSQLYTDSLQLSNAFLRRFVAREFSTLPQGGYNPPTFVQHPRDSSPDTP